MGEGDHEGYVMCEHLHWGVCGKGVLKSNLLLRSRYASVCV